MINLELQEILGKLEQGLTAELTKTVDGQTYTRVFLPENRLIPLGAATGGNMSERIPAASWIRPIPTIPCSGFWHKAPNQRPAHWCFPPPDLRRSSPAQ